MSAITEYQNAVKVYGVASREADRLLPAYQREIREAAEVVALIVAGGLVAGDPEDRRVEFFKEHAGFSVAPGESEDQGRDRTARKLANAELRAGQLGVRFVWEPERFPVDHVKEYDVYDAEPATCEVCLAYDAAGDVRASLGCIDDATTEYRRVVEAELAIEVLDLMIREGELS